MADHDFTQFNIPKSSLKDAQVISQVAYKFIIVLIKTKRSKLTESRIGDEETYDEKIGERWLCCIDQHAADERVRVERLMREVYGYAYGEDLNFNIVDNPIQAISKPEEENSILGAQSYAYDKIGLDIARYRYKNGVISKLQILEYDTNNYPDLQLKDPYYYRARPGIVQSKINVNELKDSSENDIFLENDDLYILSLPHIQRLLDHWKFDWEYIRIRKEDQQPEIIRRKRKLQEGCEYEEMEPPFMDLSASDIFLRVTAIPLILTVPLRSANLLTIARDYLAHAPGACTRNRQVERFKPRIVQQIINSRSCRYAIMFGDILTHEECSHLIKQLSECQYPFQCAHGRPSISPLCKLSSLLHNKKNYPENSKCKALGSMLESTKRHNQKGRWGSSKLGPIHQIQNDYRTLRRNLKK